MNLTLNLMPPYLTKTQEKNPSIKTAIYVNVSIFLAICVVVQLLAIDSSIENLCVSLSLFFTTLISLKYLNSLQASYFPNSFLILIGFVIGLCTMPLAIRTFEVQSLSAGLNEPIFTFGSISLFVLVTVLAHYVYVRLPILIRLRNFTINRLNPYLGLTPNFTSSVIMSTIGLAAYFINSDSGGVGIKLIKALLPLVNILFSLYCLSLIKSQFNLGQRPSKILAFLVILFFAASVILAILQNSRFIFVQSFILIIGASLFSILGLGRALKLKIVLPTILCCFILFPLLTNLTSSIAFARTWRTSASQLELLSLTVDHLVNSKEKFSVYTDKSNWWDEEYYTNELLNRLSNIKNIDNSLYIYKNIDSSRILDYQHFQLVRFVSILPNPLPSIFGVSASEKKEVNQFSSSDVLVGFISSTTESKRLTSSFISDSFLLFGFSAPIIYFFILLIVFPLSDLFSIPLQYENKLLVLSCLGILMIPVHFLFFSTGSIVDITVGYIRSIFQLSLAFFLLSRLFLIRLR